MSIDIVQHPDYGLISAHRWEKDDVDKNQSIQFQGLKKDNQVRHSHGNLLHKIVNALLSILYFLLACGSKFGSACGELILVLFTHVLFLLF